MEFAQNIERVPLLLLTMEQAASALNISERKLWELVHRGEIPRVYIGRSVRFRPSDLQDWIDAQAQRTTGRRAV